MGNLRNEICILGLELVEVGSYYFPQPHDAPWNSHLFFQLPLVDIESDSPVMLYPRTQKECTIEQVFLIPRKKHVSRDFMVWYSLFLC